jgi:hypothetical protein
MTTDLDTCVLLLNEKRSARTVAHDSPEGYTADQDATAESAGDCLASFFCDEFPIHSWLSGIEE